MNKDIMKRVRERHPNFDNLPDYDKKAVKRAEEKRIRKEQQNVKQSSDDKVAVC